MSLIYTEGYLNSKPVTSVVQDLEPNIMNMLIVPPKNNTVNTIFYIYEYDKYHPTYELHLLNHPINLTGEFLLKNHTYKVSVNKGEVQLYFEKEENK